MPETAPDFISTNPLLDQIKELALEKKAKRLIAIDVRGLSAITDFFIICHGDSEPQVKAITDNIRKGTPHKPLHLEGYESMNWILLDYLDIVVHVFKHEFRDYYHLEKMWADTPIKEFMDEKSEA